MKSYLLVSGDFTRFGGMDRANYELAWHLADRCDATVHIAAFNVQEPLANHPNIVWHRVGKLLNSYTLAQGRLRRVGRQVARQLGPDVRVIVNGGNCDWHDVVWIHALHSAWDCRHTHAPISFRARETFNKWRARRQERSVVQTSRLILTNSQRTRRQVIELLGVNESQVHSIYYGIDASVFQPATAAQRIAARQALSLPPERPVITFIGALGWDRNKGFDTLFNAHQSLCASGAWDPIVVAAGAGADGDYFRAKAAQLGLTDRIRILGFTQQIPNLLAATDLLVAPSSYESYGLAVHEALCREIPVIVSAIAGVAERYPAALQDFLLPNATDSQDLAVRMQRWRHDPDRYRQNLASFSELLRQTSWETMSSQIVDLIEQSALEPRHDPPSRRSSLDAKLAHSSN